MEGGTYVSDTQCGQVVALIFAAELVAAAGGALTHVWGDVARPSNAEAAFFGVVSVLCHWICDWVSIIAHGVHRVLEGASGCEMFTLADSALHLLVSELFLKGFFFGLAAARFGFVLLDGLPVAGGAEDDVFTDGGGVGLGASGFAFLEAEFRPVPPGGFLCAGVSIRCRCCGESVYVPLLTRSVFVMSFTFFVVLTRRPLSSRRYFQELGCGRNRCICTY